MTQTNHPALPLDSILSRIGRGRDTEEQELSEEYDGQSAYRAFSASRSPNRLETMLDLVFRNGSHESLSYAHLYQVSFDPSSGLTLNFTDHVVTITGHHLLALFRFLKNHRVTFICEADGPTAKLRAEHEAVVTAITVTPKDDRPIHV